MLQECITLAMFTCRELGYLFRRFCSDVWNLVTVDHPFKLAMYLLRKFSYRYEFHMHMNIGFWARENYC